MNKKEIFNASLFLGVVINIIIAIYDKNIHSLLGWLCTIITTITIYNLEEKKDDG